MDRVTEIRRLWSIIQEARRLLVTSLPPGPPEKWTYNSGLRYRTLNRRIERCSDKMTAILAEGN